VRTFDLAVSGRLPVFKPSPQAFYSGSEAAPEGSTLFRFEFGIEPARETQTKSKAPKQ